jgi:hypothetical protein
MTGTRIGSGSIAACALAIAAAVMAQPAPGTVDQHVAAAKAAAGQDFAARFNRLCTPPAPPSTGPARPAVRDGARRHVAAYWGGTAFNWLTNRAGYITPERPDSFWFDRYIASAQTFRGLAASAGADVLLSNHTAFDGSKSKLPAMATRRAPAPHPYVIGAEAVGRYLTVAEECARAGRLRTNGPDVGAGSAETGQGLADGPSSTRRQVGSGSYPAIAVAAVALSGPRSFSYTIPSPLTRHVMMPVASYCAGHATRAKPPDISPSLT